MKIVRMSGKTIMKISKLEWEKIGKSKGRETAIGLHRSSVTRNAAALQENDANLTRHHRTGIFQRSDHAGEDNHARCRLVDEAKGAGAWPDDLVSAKCRCSKARGRSLQRSCSDHPKGRCVALRLWCHGNEAQYRHTAHGICLEGG